MNQDISRIFVVDDEKIIAITLAMILSNSGYSAVSFTKPRDALDAIKADPPDLLLTDVSMPELSGIELAIQAKQISPGCKVLLFSGQASTADLLAQARTLGYDFALLTKPVHPAELLRAISDPDAALLR